MIDGNRLSEYLTQAIQYNQDAYEASASGPHAQKDPYWLGRISAMQTVLEWSQKTEIFYE